MNWKPTEFEDLYRIRLGENDPKLDVRSMVVDTPEYRNTLRDNTYTMFHAEHPIAVVGVSPLWKGVGVVWTLISDEARERGIALTLGVIRLLEMLHRDRGYWRIQATIKAGDEPARIWIVKLGFSYEGRMVAYGPDGTSHDMYGRVRV